jgi:hypothetical protein
MHWHLSFQCKSAFFTSYLRDSLIIPVTVSNMVYSMSKLIPESFSLNHPSKQKSAMAKSGESGGSGTADDSMANHLSLDMPNSAAFGIVEA